MTLTSPAEISTHHVPADKKYRVIQWGIGNVGTIGLRHFDNNPNYEVVGVLCNRQRRSARPPASSPGWRRAG